MATVNLKLKANRMVYNLSVSLGPQASYFSLDLSFCILNELWFLFCFVFKEGVVLYTSVIPALSSLRQEDYQTNLGYPTSSRPPEIRVTGFLCLGNRGSLPGGVNRQLRHKGWLRPRETEALVSHSTSSPRVLARRVDHHTRLGVWHYWED